MRWPFLAPLEMEKDLILPSLLTQSGAVTPGADPVLPAGLLKRQQPLLTESMPKIKGLKFHIHSSFKRLNCLGSCTVL